VSALLIFNQVFANEPSKKKIFHSLSQETKCFTLYSTTGRQL